MKERLENALLMAIAASVGITLVTYIQGEPFSLFKAALYAIVTFVVDYIFSYLFDKKRK